MAHIQILTKGDTEASVYTQMQPNCYFRAAHIDQL